MFNIVPGKAGKIPKWGRGEWRTDRAADSPGKDWPAEHQRPGGQGGGTAVSATNTEGKMAEL